MARLPGRLHSAHLRTRALELLTRLLVESEEVRPSLVQSLFLYMKQKLRDAKDGPMGIGSRLPMEMEIPIGGSVWCQSEATTTNDEGCFPFFSTYHWQTQHWPDFKQPSLRDSRIGACGVTSCHDISAALNRGLRKFACLQTLKVLFVMCSNNLLTAIPKQIEHSQLLLFITILFGIFTFSIFFWGGYYIASWLAIHEDLLKCLHASRTPHRETHFFCRCVFCSPGRARNVKRTWKLGIILIHFGDCLDQNKDQECDRGLSWSILVQPIQPYSWRTFRVVTRSGCQNW